jgi:acetyl esterase/lipase
MSRFAPFTRHDVPYHVINGVPLMATILTPARISNSRGGVVSDKKYPVMVRWHGGGFIVGHRMYEPWFAQWLLDLALDHQAIIVTPDYRLMPESTGTEILSDVAHFWRWLQRDFPRYMEQQQQQGLPRPDVGNILCCGESSGGFISVYNAFHLDSMLQPEEEDNDEDEQKLGVDTPGLEKVTIRAVISISAPLDATGPEYKGEHFRSL